MIQIMQTAVQTVMTIASNPDLVHVWCESVVAANVMNGGSRSTGGGTNSNWHLGVRF
jgi:hypothetical protein